MTKIILLLSRLKTNRKWCKTKSCLRNEMLAACRLSSQSWRRGFRRLKSRIRICTGRLQCWQKIQRLHPCKIKPSIKQLQPSKKLRVAIQLYLVAWPIASLMNRQSRSREAKSEGWSHFSCVFFGLRRLDQFSCAILRSLPLTACLRVRLPGRHTLLPWSHQLLLCMKIIFKSARCRWKRCKSSCRGE